MSSIEWTDETWNPTRGCSRVSEGCRNCYAERVAARFSGPGQPYEGLARRVLRVVNADEHDPENRSVPRWTGDVRLVADRLGVPLHWRKPRKVFVNSMSDLFHEALTNEEIAVVFGVMAACPQHTFQCLTKRPTRMHEFLTHPEVRNWVAKARDAALVERDHDVREQWKAIPSLSLYEASSHGRIRNRDKTILQPQLNEHEQIGRYTITVYDDGVPTTQFVHRLVLLAFRGKPNFGEEGCHRNGNKTDNRIANLRWGTRSDNQRDKVKHGARGGPAKLTIEQAAEIRKRRENGETQQSIADAFGVSRSLVSMIQSGEVWAPPRDLAWPLPNVWLGVSVENQGAADERIPELLKTPAAVRFLSVEPLIGPVDLSAASPNARSLADDLDWVIVGCESGPGARACDVAWIRALRDQCASAKVPLFLKQAEETLCHGDHGFDPNPDGVIEEIVTWGDGSEQKARRPGGNHIIGLPYLDGVQHAAFPVTPA